VFDSWKQHDRIMYLTRVYKVSELHGKKLPIKHNDEYYTSPRSFKAIAGVVASTCTNYNQQPKTNVGIKYSPKNQIISR
jgi:hypothetical protein